MATKPAPKVKLSTKEVRILVAVGPSGGARSVTESQYMNCTDVQRREENMIRDLKACFTSDQSSRVVFTWIKAEVDAPPETTTPPIRTIVAK